jgi:hypothetical protein
VKIVIREGDEHDEPELYVYSQKEFEENFGTVEEFGDGAVEVEAPDDLLARLEAVAKPYWEVWDEIRKLRDKAQGRD